MSNTKRRVIPLVPLTRAEYRIHVSPQLLGESFLDNTVLPQRVASGSSVVITRNRKPATLAGHS